MLGAIKSNLFVLLLIRIGFSIREISSEKHGSGGVERSVLCSGRLRDGATLILCVSVPVYPVKVNAYIKMIAALLYHTVNV